MKNKIFLPFQFFFLLLFLESYSKAPIDNLNNIVSGIWEENAIIQKVPEPSINDLIFSKIIELQKYGKNFNILKN